MAGNTQSADTGSGDIKLSCRNVWKIYGADPDQFFSAGSGV